MWILTKSLAFNIFRFLKLSYSFVITHGRYTVCKVILIHNVLFNIGFKRNVSVISINKMTMKIIILSFSQSDMYFHCKSSCIVTSSSSYTYFSPMQFSYEFTSSMSKNVFLYGKTGPAPVWLHRENYSSAFYLVALSEEIYFGRKYREQKNAYWSPKRI